MSTIMPDPAECQHADVRRDRFDEPGGVVCSLSRDWDGCGAEDGECPRIHPAKQFCPECLRRGYLSKLAYDEDEDHYGCDGITSDGERTIHSPRLFWPDQLEDAWNALEESRKVLVQSIKMSKEVAA